MSQDLLTLVIPQIDREESCRLTAYLDEYGIPTIGWGRADPGVHLGITCTQAEADAWRDAKIQSLVHSMESGLPWWNSLSAPRQAVLVEMAYQMGVGGMMAFHAMLSRLSKGDWDGAALAMLDSKWARVDSPARAQREAAQMRTGVVA